MRVERNVAAPHVGLETWQKLLFGFVLWFLLTEVLLADLVDRGIATLGFAPALMVLHAAVNPVLACIVASVCLLALRRTREARKVVTALVGVPLLFTIAYCGVTLNGAWMRLLGWELR